MRIKTVRVKEGDTLWSLAEKYLGDPNRWTELFLINATTLAERGRVPNKIGPNYIFPGTDLKVLNGLEFDASANFDPSANK